VKGVCDGIWAEIWVVIGENKKGKNSCYLLEYRLVVLMGKI